MLASSAFVGTAASSAGSASSLKTPLFGLQAYSQDFLLFNLLALAPCFRTCRSKYLLISQKFAAF